MSKKNPRVIIDSLLSSNVNASADQLRAVKLTFLGYLLLSIFVFAGGGFLGWIVFTAILLVLLYVMRANPGLCANN